ncbi:GerA spore germination protein [Alkaliphilus metalliredigens QYMF]|uniref:GerA spore germination protein n=1 Tax=Alkaliphilus metalliredigens (strain QYMF) TaxID=293826 RepID=A6TLM7_ALKMQ|nr:spore germination protein [Alkaliphilus metalliredigens]ABR47095.1 GerA spore germination protein [Alkaliphilus metalliredigens QYMF]
MGLFDKFKRLKSNFTGEPRPYIEDSRLVSKKLHDNTTYLENRFKDCSDITFRELRINAGSSKSGLMLLVFTDGLIDSTLVNESIIKPINFANGLKKSSDINVALLQDIILINSIRVTKKLDEIIHSILSGDTVLFIEGSDEALLLDTRGGESRSIEESSVESVIRGSKEGFVENIRTNTAMIRRKLKDPNLKIKDLKVGSRSHTSVAVVYIDDIVNQEVLQYTLNKLEEIKIDGIFDSGYIEQFLENNTFSIFPQMQVTERPDKVCGNLLEGRMVVLVDGSPDALIFPVGLVQLLQSPDDYYERFIFANMVRLIRYLGFVIATTFPAIYVAVTTFHQDLLPADFILDIAKTRVDVPFPPVVEAMLMEGTIELLREASARLPSKIGQTIGIVGALVIGDAAVRARIISPMMVVVVAITAIGSYIFPHFSTSYSIRFIRLPMILMAATFGAFGIIITWTWIIAHMCKLNSFGYPFLAPFAPINTDDMKDAVLRAPLWGLKTRPTPASNRNKRRK